MKKIRFFYFLVLILLTLGGVAFSINALSGTDDISACETPTETPTPTPTPSCPTETPTPQMTATPTPTSTPIPELTATPTPTIVSEQPTATPTQTQGDNNQANQGGNQPGMPGPAVCGAETPKAPVLLSVDRPASDRVNLIWFPVDQATHYSISYGLTSGNYIYGVDNTGGKDNKFTIGGLATGQNYCFAVRAVNDCAPGPLSNEICTGGTSRGQVLGASTLGETGDITEEIFRILLIAGSVLVAVALRKFQSIRKAAYSFQPDSGNSSNESGIDEFTLGDLDIRQDSVAQLSDWDLGSLSKDNRVQKVSLSKTPALHPAEPAQLSLFSSI